VNFSGGNEAAGISIKEVIEINYVITLILVEAKGPEGAGEAVRDN
jgi:hypothetical protein